MAHEVRSLLIPVRESDQKVEVFVDEFPEDANDIIDILRAEIAPLDIWLQFAVEYYRQGKVEQFMELLSVASEPGIERIYHDAQSRISRLKILNALAAHTINSMWKETDPKKRDTLEQNAVSLFQKADRIDQRYTQTLVGKGIMTLSKGDDEKAMSFLEPALKIAPTNLPALLGQGCYYFRKRKYESARALYEKAIRLDPNGAFASAIRVCYGLCCYKMNQMRRATDAMRRALELDPNNANAMVGLSLIEEEEASKSGNASDAKLQTLMMMHRAYNACNTNPLVLNHISSGYFLQWDELPGGCIVQQGSNVVTTHNDLTLDICAGDRIRLGTDRVFRVTSIEGKTILLEKNYHANSRNNVPIFIQDFERVLALASNAYNSTQVNGVKAESCYMMGRAHHAKGRHEEAYRSYFQARSLSPEFSLASYGLGQTYLQKKNYEKAITCFEDMLKMFPEDYDTLHHLGILYNKVNRRKEAIQCLNRANDIESNTEILIELAQIHQHSHKQEDMENSLRFYQKVEELLTTSYQTIPMELYCNMGVLQYKLQNYKECEELYYKAIELTRSESGDEDVHHHHHEIEQDSKKGGEQEQEREQEQEQEQDTKKIVAMNVTIWYNLGRLKEITGNVDQAIAIYNRILVAFPNYLDCYLRLGCIDRDHGKLDEAEEKFTEALNRKHHNPDACALIANINLSKDKKHYAKAQKHVEAIMGMPKGKNDAYAMLSLGNIYISSLDDMGKYDKYLDTAKSYFKSILQADHTNMYAANGLGIYLAEKGYLEAAKHIFSKVADIQLQMPQASLNLAHLHVAQERSGKAAQIYKALSKEYYNNQDSEVLLLLANALFHNESYEECIKTLSKAIHLNPSDNTLWYNLAVAQEECAVKTLEDSTNRTLKRVGKAVEYLNNAQSIFEVLCSMTENIKLLSNDKREKPQQHLQYCKDTLIAALKHLEYEKANEEQKKKDLEKQLLLRQEYERKKQEIKEKERLQKEEEAKRLAEVYLKRKDHLSRLQGTWQENETRELEKLSKKKSGKKRKKTDNTEEGSGRDSSEDETSGNHWHRNEKMEKLLAKKKQKADTDLNALDERDIFGSDSDSDDANNPGPSSSSTGVGDSVAQQERELFGSDSDE